VTGTTRPGEAAAVEAVRARSGKTNLTSLVYTAEELVALVYPVIAAAVREQAAQDIEARVHPDEDRAKWDSYDRGYAKAGRFAAEIVRGAR
jgi:hypothetical protein